MYIYMHISIYTCIYTCISLCIYRYIYIYTSPCGGIFLYMGIAPNICTPIHVGVYPPMGGYTPRNPLRALSSELTGPRRPFGHQLALARLGSTGLGRNCQPLQVNTMSCKWSQVSANRTSSNPCNHNDWTYVQFNVMPCNWTQCLTSQAYKRESCHCNMCN